MYWVSRYWVSFVLVMSFFCFFVGFLTYLLTHHSLTTLSPPTHHSLTSFSLQLSANLGPDTGSSFEMNGVNGYNGNGSSEFNGFNGNFNEFNGTYNLNGNNFQYEDESYEDISQVLFSLISL